MATPKKNYLFFVEDEGYAQRAFGPTIEAGGYEILGPVVCKEDAIHKFEEHQSEIIVALIDLMLPEKVGESDTSPEKGYEIAKLLKSRGVPVVVISAIVFPEILLDSIQQEISYLVKKDAEDHVLLQALEMAMTGCGVYSYQAFQELARLVKQKNAENPLDEEQWELLERRISGRSIREIAHDKGYATSTISNKFTDIYELLNVANQIEAIRWYQKNAHKYGRHIS